MTYTFPPLETAPKITELLARGAPVALGVSGGKDSDVATAETLAYLKQVGHAGPRILIHSDLGRIEWKDSLPACERLARRYDLELVVVKRQAGDLMDRWLVRWRNNCERYAHLQCVKLILPWSTASMRFCTSELKTAIIFRKWPQDEQEEAQIEPVTHSTVGGDFPLETDSQHIRPYPKKWQQYASPVWMDINQMRVLNVEQARESQDEKHVCPLQLDVIERAVQLWTNPGDVVFSPFAGIGSEGFEALRLGRKFVGVELKESYFQVARKNLERVEREKTQATLWQEGGE